MTGPDPQRTRGSVAAMSKHRLQAHADTLAEPHMPQRTLTAAARDRRPLLRAVAASHANSGPSILQRLAADPRSDVRAAVASRSD